MALQLHFPFYFPKKPFHNLPRTPFLLSPTKSNLVIKSQKPTVNTEPANDATPPQNPKAKSPGQGFGLSSSSPSSSSSKSDRSNKKKQKGRRERASIIRRSPVEQPSFTSQEDKEKAQEQSRNESAFLLAWLGLGAIILVEGIVLAASGFLPEEWDTFFVKYLYPSFTPTVFSFVAGTVAYGVLKYLENDKLNNKK